MLKQKLILSYFSQIFINLLQVVVTIIVARIAGASVLGTIAFATSYVSMFMVIFDLGQGVAHIKLISEGKDEAACIGTFMRIQLVLAGVFALSVLLFINIQKYIVGIPFESNVHETVIYLTLLAITINNIYTIARTTFNAKTEQAKADIPDLTRNLIYQILRLIVVIIGFKAVAISISNLAATIMVLPMILYFFKGYSIGKFNKDLFRQYVIIAVPIIILNVAEIFSSYIDKVLLQYLTNSEEVGYYVAGLSIGGFILMIGNSIGMLLFPTFSKKIAENDYNSINNIVLKYERFIILFLLPVTFSVSESSDIIVKLILGHKYINTIPVLSIATVTSLFYAYFMVYGNIITGKGKFKTISFFYIIKLISLIAIIYVLVSPQLYNLKGYGLAISMMVATIILGCCFVIYLHFYDKKLTIFPNKIQLSVTLIYFLLISYFYPAQNLFIKISYVVFSLAVYYIAGYFTRLIKKDDFREFADVFNISKMKGYIFNEIKQPGD
ncbi:MAG: oligosaccharide flippase family protein [Bacteroidetes bacterium]|nr:oligosaccharide flippase family protein [Bacteroidota bacterium]